MLNQLSGTSEKFSDKAVEPSATGLIIKEIFQANDLSDISSTIKSLNKRRPYQAVHIGICSLHGIPVKDVIHSCPVGNLDMSVNDFSEGLKWSVCRESEHLLRPYDLLSHQFETVETSQFDELREFARRAGLKQVMIIPMKVKNTTTVVIIDFPRADFEDHASDVLPQLYQIMLSIFERFPKLLSWPNGGMLTRREAEILSLSATGLTEANIAEQCGISINTVRNHVENSKSKLNARNKLHAVMIATENYEIDRIPDLKFSSASR